MVGVSWHEASAFAAWAGKRLPTANEWQRAAGWPERCYPWGNHLRPEVCNTREAKLDDTTEVGQFSPNGDSPLGIADLAGNCWEWVADPAGSAQQYRHLRGGGWQYSADFARSDATAYWQAPDQRHASIGFRLCFQVAKEEQPS